MDLRITFEQAKALKELGFPYSKYIPTDVINWRPTVELVSKWLREEKNIHVCPIYYSSKTYKTEWYSCEVNQHQINNDEEYSTYEAALIAGIDKAIEILKINE